MIPFAAVTIPNINIATYFATGLICSLGFPLLFLLLKNKTQVRFVPFIIGAATYMVLVLFAESQLRTWVIDPDSKLYDMMVANPSLYMLVIGFGTGIIVEGGKYLVFYFIKKWYSSHKTAMAFHLGFGSVHMMFFVGIQYIVYSWLSLKQNMNIRSGAQGLDYPELLRSLANRSPIEIPVVAIEGLLYLALTFGLTYLVWYSATRPFKLYYLYTAVLLHAIFFAPYALIEVAVLKTSALFYSIMAVVAATSLVIAFFVYRASVRNQDHEQEPDLFS
ncbi:MAG: YhfC family intramembrane metalloprotease [Clostridiales bacterium]|jgi:uncharacterized membrane protein YhfC|nr:YhfC family intramembrane metalloprotease [Clostridiales bacterium]